MHAFTYLFDVPQTIYAQNFNLKASFCRKYIKENEFLFFQNTIKMEYFLFVAK